MEYKKFLQNLKQLREEKGISMKQMGARLGVSYIQYGNIEAGRSGFKVQDLFVVCKALKVHPKHLLEGNMARVSEYSLLFEEIRKLPEREFKIAKDLVMLMNLSVDDL